MSEKDEMNPRDARDILSLANIEWRTSTGLRAYSRIAEANIIAASKILAIFQLADADLLLEEDALASAIDALLLAAVKTVSFPDPVPLDANTFDELGAIWDGHIASVKQLNKNPVYSTKHDWTRRASHLAAWNIEFSMVGDYGHVGPIETDSVHRAAIRLAPELWSDYHVYVNEAENSPDKRPELWDKFIRKWDPETVSTQCEVLRAKLPVERKSLRTRLNLFDDDDRPKQNTEDDLATTNKAAIDCITTVARIRKLIRDAMASFTEETYPGSGQISGDPGSLWDAIPKIRTDRDKLVAQHEYLELCLHSTADLIHQVCASPTKVAEISLNKTKSSERSFHEIALFVAWCIQHWIKEQLLDREKEFYCYHGENELYDTYSNLLEQWAGFDDASIGSKLRRELSDARRIAQKEHAKEDVGPNDIFRSRETPIIFRTLLVSDEHGNLVGRFDPSAADLLIEFDGERERDLAGNMVETLCKLYRLPSRELARVSISKVNGEWLDGRLISESEAHEWLSNNCFESDAILAPDLSAPPTHSYPPTEIKKPIESSKRGPKGLGKTDDEYREGILKRWAYAKQNGKRQGEFCREEGIPVKVLAKYINTANQRNRRKK